MAKFKVYGVTEYDGTWPVEPEFCEGLEAATRVAMELVDECYLLTTNNREHTEISTHVGTREASAGFWVDGSNHGEGAQFIIKKDGADLTEAEAGKLLEWCSRLRWHICEDVTRYRYVTAAEAASIVAQQRGSCEESGRALWCPRAGLLVTFPGEGPDRCLTGLSGVPFEEALCESASAAGRNASWIGARCGDWDAGAPKGGSAVEDYEREKLERLIAESCRDEPWVLCTWGERAEEGALALPEMVCEHDERLAELGRMAVTLQVTDDRGWLLLEEHYTVPAGTDPARKLVEAALADAEDDDRWEFEEPPCYTWGRFAELCGVRALAWAGVSKYPIPPASPGSRSIVRRAARLPVVTKATKGMPDPSPRG